MNFKVSRSSLSAAGFGGTGCRLLQAEKQTSYPVLSRYSSTPALPLRHMGKAATQQMKLWETGGFPRFCILHSSRGPGKFPPAWRAVRRSWRWRREHVEGWTYCLCCQVAVSFPERSALMASQKPKRWSLGLWILYLGLVCLFVSSVSSSGTFHNKIQILMLWMLRICARLPPQRELFLTLPSFQLVKWGWFTNL